VCIRDSDSNGGFRIAVIQISNEIVSEWPTPDTYIQYGLKIIIALPAKYNQLIGIN
jgi:hypothetical protein